MPYDVGEDIIIYRDVHTALEVFKRFVAAEGSKFEFRGRRIHLRADPKHRWTVFLDDDQYKLGIIELVISPAEPKQAFGFTADQQFAPGSEMLRDYARLFGSLIEREGLDLPEDRRLDSLAPTDVTPATELPADLTPSEIAIVKYWPSLSAPEIAAKLNIPVKTVTNKIGLLRKRLGKTIVPMKKRAL